MVIDDTGSVEDIHAFIYCKKWRSGQVLPMPHSLTHSLTTLKDRATQLLIKYKSGALVTQLVAERCVPPSTRRNVQRKKCLGCSLHIFTPCAITKRHLEGIL